MIAPGPPRILCVDDEPAMLDVYQRVLTDADGSSPEAAAEIQSLEAELFGAVGPRRQRRRFDAVVCRQGDEAVELVWQALEAKSPFPVIFLDVRMPPGPDGVATAERIRSLDEEAELVIVTAYSDTDPQEIGERIPCPAGGLYYLQKPVHRFELWQLASALTSTWESRRQAREARALLEQANDLLRRDIVQRARIERELDAKKRELESLFYTLSHDLCAPVVSIAGFASLLQEHAADQLDDDGRMFLGRLQANLEALTTMLRGARGLSEALRDAGPKVPVSAAAAAAKAVRRLADLVEQSGATIIIPDDLASVVYPREGLIEIFEQLIGNAIRFARQGVTPRIEIGHERQASFDRFLVRDNGAGFPSGFRQRVFDAFVRLQPDRAPGAGIGLTVVRRIVEDNGGQVGADSVPGEGSTFWFTIPRECEVSATPPASAASAA